MMSAISRHILQPLLVIAAVVLANTCTPARQVAVQVDGGKIRIEFDDHLYSRVVSTIGKEEVVLGAFSPSEFISVSGGAIMDFTVDSESSHPTEDEIGAGRKYRITARAPSIIKEVMITSYDDFPTMLAMQVTYTNSGGEDLKVEGWTNHGYRISTPVKGREKAPFWSYQSGSYEDRHDWVLPLAEGFAQQNYLGMNASDYGGGTPVVDVWRPDAGLAVGHLELVPKLISLPVAMPNSREATVAVSYNRPAMLPPGESLTTLRTFVMVHHGDYFPALSEYRRFMIRQGVEFHKAPETAFEPIWCAWGYRRDFTMDQIYGTLPMVKQLGYKWAVLDDGWQTAEGDWYLDDTKFPNGDADMIKFVDRIHTEGLGAKLWWAPLAVDPGTDLIEQHPDYLLLNEDGSTQDITWWDSYYLCPASPEVVAYTKELVIKMIKTWGYDGLKIDGQHLNGVPPCYNPAHKHACPEESVEELPAFFKMIYETALSIKPEAVVEICPCGTAYNFFMLPYMNQAVSSDPLSSWQIRLKGKTLRALSGSYVAYYGDHVELSDGGTDFASTVGIGGVIGTKFTWPVGARKDPECDLTSPKAKKWDKWMKIYQAKMLPLRTYRGELYDIGFDRPEAHAIEKGDNMYYAFYASNWDGEVELRGLEARTYRVYDYVNARELDRVTGPIGRLKIAFDAYLLMEATPE